MLAYVRVEVVDQHAHGRFCGQPLQESWLPCGAVPGVVRSS